MLYMLPMRGGGVVGTILSKWVWSYLNFFDKIGKFPTEVSERDVVVVELREQCDQTKRAFLSHW